MAVSGASKCIKWKIEDQAAETRHWHRKQGNVFSVSCCKNEGNQNVGKKLAQMNKQILKQKNKAHICVCINAGL